MDQLPESNFGDYDIIPPEEDGLRFKTTGMVKNKGYVTIKLNGRDLYDIEFGKVRKLEYKVLKREEDVFAEDMVNFIDSMVG